MPRSLVQIYLHIVFSTKHRKPFLKNAEVRNKTHAYLAGILNNSDSPAIKVGGVEDHVHLLCRLGKQMNVSDLLRELKRDSSKWIKEQDRNSAIFIGKTVTARSQSAQDTSMN
jgi:putative transposase